MKDGSIDTFEGQDGETYAILNVEQKLEDEEAGVVSITETQEAINVEDLQSIMSEYGYDVETDRNGGTRYLRAYN